MLASQMIINTIGYRAPVGRTASQMTLLYVHVPQFPETAHIICHHVIVFILKKIITK